MRFLSLILAALLLLCLAPAASARDINLVGVGVGVSSSEYRSSDPTVLPLPVLNFENRDFYIRGLTAGWHLYYNEAHQVSVDVSYLAQHFYSSETNSSSMRRLYDRYPTMMAGASYTFKSPYGAFRLSAAHDVLGVNDGTAVTGTYALPIRIKALTLTPRAGLTWTDKSFNNYYYGVSSKESRRSGYRKYTAGDGVSPLVGLGATFTFAESWNLFLDAGATFLNQEVTDSPMVSHKIKYSAGGGLTYSF